MTSSDMARSKFIEAAERFAKALLDCDRLDAMHEDEIAESAYQAACNEYNLSKRLMGEAYAVTLIRPADDGDKTK